MGKIKGWSKSKKYGGWVNSSAIIIVRDKEVWITDVFEYEFSGELLFTGKTKKQALDYAMKYMRSHQ